MFLIIQANIVNVARLGYESRMCGYQTITENRSGQNCIEKNIWKWNIVSTGCQSLR